MLKRHYAKAMALSLLLLLASMLLSLTLGSADVSLADTIRVLMGLAPGSPLAETIIWHIRLPRLLCAVLVGAGLAVSGAILQNASRNPLADPYLFGLMAGAGLGATLVSVVLPAQLVGIAAGAFAGALFAVALVFVVCAGQHWRKVEITLLAGVAVSFATPSKNKPPLPATLGAGAHSRSILDKAAVASGERRRINPQHRYSVPAIMA